MLGELIDECSKLSRVRAARSGSIVLLAMLFLLLMSLMAQAATPVAVSDPQLTQLKLATDTTLGSMLNVGVSVSGNTAAFASLRTTCVYVFADGAWRLQQTIPVGGIAVSVSGNNLIIGNPDAGNQHAGAAYIYTRSGSTWTWQRTISGEAAGDRLGMSVGVFGSTFIVGAPNADSWSASCSAPNQDSGAAYVYEGISGATQKLRIDYNNPRDHFGFSVSVSGNKAIVGARDFDLSHPDTGLAVVYERNSEGVWRFSDSFCAPDAEEGDNFGAAVAISGDTALVGSPSNRLTGSAYVYTRQNGASPWGLQRKLTSPDAYNGAYYGNSVALSGDTAVVGAPYDCNRTVNDGSVYYYTRRGTTWGSERKVVPSASGWQGLFGSSVGLSGSNAIVGESGSNEAFIHANLLSYSVNEDATLTVPAISGILINDQTMGATPQLINTKSLHGKLKLAKDGSFVYKPEANFDGTATARYRLISRSKASKSATITIVVNPLQKPPVARDDFFTTKPDGVLLQLADEGEGLLANDTDPDGDKILVSFRPSWPKHAGWMNVLPDGSFSYVPRAGFIGTDTFWYDITDGHGGRDIARVSIKVSTGEPPVAVSDSEPRQFKLFSEDPGISMFIGSSVAVSGDTAIVGTVNVTTPTVYAYNRNGSVWNLEQRILPPFLDHTAGFGCSVSVSGNTMVIGAARSGMAYVYARPSAHANWILQTQLQGSFFEFFGSSVRVSDDTIVVGAPGARVNGCSNAGAAYVYSRTAAGWSFPKRLESPAPASESFLGYSAACSGDHVILGAPGAPNLDSPGVRSGGGVIFTRNGTAWDSGVRLPCSAQADAAFGYSVSISGDAAVVGARGERDYESGRQGAAYVFANLDEAWRLQKKLTAEGSGSFGDSVSVSDDNLIVGAPAAVGSGPAAYVYTRRGNTWGLSNRLASGKPDGRFGCAVCASGSTAIIGAPIEDYAGVAYIETGLSPYVTDQDTSLYVPASLGVLVNDSTVDLTPELVDTSSLHGSLEFIDDGGGSFVYDPDPGFTGTAVAKYRVTDGKRTSAPATITIVVNAPNHFPEARDDTATVTAGTILSVPAPGVLANDTDVDGDELMVSLKDQPRRKEGFSLSPDGSYHYVSSNPKDRTADSFTYIVVDGRGGIDSGTVQIALIPSKPAVR